MICAIVAALALLAQSPPPQIAGKYEVSLRLPADGLFAREEMEIEARISDRSKNDPVMGNAPVIRAVVDAIIDMPSMPGMPKITERSHSEAVAGDYGIHPVFAHAGEFRLTLNVTPPGGAPFTVQFPLIVKDADPSRPKLPPVYRVEVKTNPNNPRAGQPVELQLRVFHRDRPKEVISAFDLAHERFLHLVIVRNDLTCFAHEHPEIGRDGVFRLRYSFPDSGEFRLFADVAPKGAGSQVLSATVKVAGKGSPPPAASDSVFAKRTQFAPLPARKTERITFKTIASDLEVYLGAMGHLMFVSEGASQFVHAHPDESLDGNGRDGTLTFLTRFPSPGRYRGWVQVQRHGKVLTDSFDVTVVEQ
jgi:hypothetical protein